MILVSQRRLRQSSSSIWYIGVSLVLVSVCYQQVRCDLTERSRAKHFGNQTKDGCALPVVSACVKNMGTPRIFPKLSEINLNLKYEIYLNNAEPKKLRSNIFMFY